MEERMKVRKYRMEYLDEAVSKLLSARQSWAESLVMVGIELAYSSKERGEVSGEDNLGRPESLGETRAAPGEEEGEG